MFLQDIVAKAIALEDYNLLDGMRILLVNEEEYDFAAQIVRCMMRLLRIKYGQTMAPEMALILTYLADMFFSRKSI